MSLVLILSKVVLLIKRTSYTLSIYVLVARLHVLTIFLESTLLWSHFVSWCRALNMVLSYSGEVAWNPWSNLSSKTILLPVELIHWLLVKLLNHILVQNRIEPCRDALVVSLHCQLLHLVLNSQKLVYFEFLFSLSSKYRIRINWLDSTSLAVRLGVSEKLVYVIDMSFGLLANLRNFGVIVRLHSIQNILRKFIFNSSTLYLPFKSILFDI